MRSGKDQILTSLRRSKGRDGPVDAETAAALRARIAGHARNIVPARTELDAGGLVDLFETMATKVHATVARVSDVADVPGAVSDYLRGENLPSEVVMAPDPSLDSAPWADNKLLEIRRGVPGEPDQVSITSASHAVAETGTLAMFSGPDHPSTLNFIPETHVVVFPASRVVKSYEDVWDALREQAGDETYGRGGLPPRTVNFVTGPSRSGDIEQTLLLGAHGPRRLHIVIVEDGEGDG
ncbi:MAG: lactate utilization protein [Rhodospirillaceae bacterium]|nr:lactate utilization protein [Rhodospirillaceae bacterium]|tara:strand:- start:167 stop:880 length:714 start_codon:yes stop_codon:yes gene_type:complete